MRAVHTAQVLPVGYISALIRAKLLPFISILGILTLGTLAFLYFHPVLAVWLLILAALTYLQPTFGASVLFAIISIDTAQPLFGKIFVSYSELEFAACLLAWLAAKKCSNVNWRPLLWGSPFIATVFLSGVINLPWYKVVPHTVRASELIFALFFTSNLFRNEATAKIFRWGLSAAVMFYCSTGLIQRETGITRIYSYFTNTNQFAGYLNLLLPFFTVFFFISVGKRIRLFWAYLIVLLIISELDTASRSALLGAILAALILWLLFYRRRLPIFVQDPIAVTRSFTRRKALDFVVGLIVVGMLVSAQLVAIHYFGIYLAGKPASLVIHPIEDASRSVDQSLQDAVVRSKGGVSSSIANYRLPYYRLAGQIWKDHLWFGVGPGNYAREVQKRWGFTLQYKGQAGDVFRENVGIHAHNLCLQLGVDYGIAGLLAFLLLIGLVARRLLQTRSRSAWPLAGLGVLIAFSIHNLFDVTFPSLALEMGLLLGTSLLWDITSPQNSPRIPGLFTKVHRRDAKNTKITQRTGVKLEV